MVAAAMAAFFCVGARRADMAVFLTLKALGDPTPCFVSFCHFQIEPNDYPFVNKAIRLFGGINLNN
jgi:hypothetical protein